MQWTIAQIDSQFVDGQMQPATAHWRVSHSEDEFSGSVYGTVSVLGIKTLTLQSVLDHIWSKGVPKEASESAVLRQIEDAKAKANQPVLPKEMDIEQVSQAHIAEIHRQHREMLLRLTGYPTDVERNTWPEKIKLADAILSGDPLDAAQTAFLVSYGATTEAARTAYAQAVKTNAGRYQMLVGLADGVRRRCIGRMEAAAATLEAIDAACKANQADRDAALAAVQQAA